MSISFKDSLLLANNAAKSEAALAVEPVMAADIAPAIAPAVATAGIEEPAIMTLSLEDENDMIAAYAGDEWILDTKYRFYPEYNDDAVSIVDENKNIVLNSDQINVTQETNSQFIPFEMPRFYDGFDLSTTSLLFHFVNKDGYEDYANPINVYYNSNRIKFAWLVDKRVTAVAGIVEFEIQAVGVNSKGDEYIWISKISKGLNILKSLSGNGVIEPDDTWVTTFLTQVTEQVSLAQAAANDAQNAVSESQTYAQQASEAAANAQTIVSTAKDELTSAVQSAVDEKVSTALSDFYTKEEVDNIVSNIDISDQLDEIKNDIANIDGLANFNVEYDGSVMTFYNGETVIKAIEINSDPSAEWTSAYTTSIDGRIAEATGAVQTSLNEYKETVDADLEQIHTTIDDLPTTLANDYYTKEACDNTFAKKDSVTNVEQRVTAVESSIDTHTQNIGTLSATVADLQEEIDSVDKSPRLTYEATYDEEQIYTLWEIEGEGDNEVRTPKGQFKISGGGGASSSSVLKIEYVTKTPLAATVDDKILITYIFSGTDSSGDAVLEGTATWKVGNTTVATQTIAAGENTFDITDYIAVGTHKVTLSVSDDAGSLATKKWTVQRLDVRVESDFNDALTYPIGPLSFGYTPYGAISKTVHFVLDGEEIGTEITSASGIPLPYEIPAQENGSRLLDVYMTADINGNTVESNHVTKDILWYDGSAPIIGCVQQNFTAKQHDVTNITFRVYDPATETPTVILKEDGVFVEERTLDGNTDSWQYKSTEVGVHTLTIACGEIVKTLTATIEALDITLEPVTAGLVFDFNPTGKSNNNADRLWSNGDVSMSVSDNFDWINGGYQYDDNGDQYFCIKAGTSANIDYRLFADDAKKNGKEFKLVFKTTNVAKPDATFLHCMDNTTETDHIGIQMDVHEAFIYGQAGKLHLPYSEEDIIEFEFNISKDTEAIPMVMGYEDGVSTCPMVYDDSHNFTQNTPKIISLGSDDCDLHIYRFKVYNTSLTDRGILNNFIADARNAEEMISRYNRNQIYDENQNLDPDVLAEKCPWFRIIKIEAPHFTNGKKYPVNNTTIEYIYKNGDPVLDNWKAVDAVHVGQGASSDNYGAAGRNMDLVLKPHKDFNNSPVITLSDGTVVDKVSLTRESIPVDYFNVKVNIASSENANNALLQRRYNAYNPYNRAFVRAADTLEDHYTSEEIAEMTEDQKAKILAGYQADTDALISHIKDTMEFHNCVVFIKETDQDMSTHTEFNDNNWHFYAIGSVGDSKKTDKTRLTDPDDEYECIIELMDVQLPLSDFPVNTMMNAMGFTVDKVTNEKKYTWATDNNLGILYELIDGEYVLTKDTTVDLTKTYYVDILEHDDFSEDYTYGWRYISDEDNADIVNYCHQKWIDFYRFVTTSTDEEFKAHLGDYVALDSVLYYYLFTTRYTMVDNRAKNLFFHYGKTGEVGSDGNPVRKWDLAFDYDNDTALGINNYGDMVYRYGLEDTHVDENGVEIFRESDSTFFCRVRDLFDSELKAMYNSLESQNAWHGEGLISQFDEWQSEFPEELWRIDIDRKYIRTYNSSHINGKGDSQFLVDMAHGKKKYQRRQYERNQEKYMASKYQSSVAASDENSIVIRCGSIPDGNLAVKPNYSLTLTPYAYMYLNVEYATGVVQVPIRELGVPVTVPFSGDSTDIIKIYSAASIQSIGDLSPCYARTINTSSASKLKELIIGNGTAGYDNPYLTSLTTGANYLLEKINIENVSGLTNPLNLSVLSNLKELYAQGSNIGGVTFADGGRIEIAELPAINAITMKNLVYLTTLDVTDFSKLITLTVENCNTIDLINVLNSAANINRVRITGVDWSLENTDLLERLYSLKGIDKNGYNTERAVLAGKVHVPVIRQQKLYDYHAAWSDLEITYDTMIEQFPVTFKNDDGSILEVQYVDKGEDAIDPTTRTDNPMIPTKESSVQYNYTFAGWDSSLAGIFSDRTITATYTESIRSYTIKYVSKGLVMQESTGLYGENVPYTGVSPTYTAEESGYTYYLFNRWDKSGFIDGDKTVEAIFDKFTYTATAFDGKELSDLTPVEIYAMNKLGLFENIITDKDPYTIVVGNDVEYDDIESELLISEKTYFDGTNYIDTEIQLFDEDKDFVLAIDYEFLDGNKANAVLAQCFQANGMNGFKLWYNSASDFSGAKMTWGTSSDNVITTNKREIIVIRHKKGDNNLTIYKSNLDGDEVLSTELVRTKSTIGTGTLVFGAARADDGIYENHAIGNVNWAKVWFADLGESVCKDLATWTHESITLEACGFRKYYLSDNASKRCSFSLLASHLLGRTARWNATNVNAGGWADSELNMNLNGRLYNAIPSQFRELIKRVSVGSSAGQMSGEVTYSNCYITIPALIEVDPTQTSDPYNNEGTPISYFSTNDTRKRTLNGGEYADYWLRSPNVNYPNYIWRVEADGQVNGITNATGRLGVLIEISL